MGEEVLKGANINGLRADTAAPSDAARAPVAFGPFEFDRASRLLAKHGLEIPLPPRVLGVLALLLDKPGQLVTKQELMGAVWRDAFVTETSLAEAVSVLRQTLGDDPQRPTYIQTLHRRGYRFIAEVSAGSGAALDPVDRSFPQQPQDPAKERDPRLSILVPWLITVFAVTIAASAVWKYVNVAEPPARPPARFTLALPEGVTLAETGAPVAVSRDGGMIAFAGCRGECGIYLRPLAQAEPTFVAGTSGGAAPFFSPDGRWLAYFASGRLNKIALAGGSPVSLAAAPQPLGGTWTRDGRIVFASSTYAGLSILAEDGGEVRPLTDAAGGVHRWPDALPDGSAIVFSVTDAAHPRQHYAGIVSLRTRAWGRLLDDVSAVRAPIGGYLVAQRGTDLLGVTFDRRTLSVSGLPVPVLSGIVRTADVPQFATSEAGVLAIGAPGNAQTQVVLDWHGELRRLVPPPAPTLPR